MKPRLLGICVLIALVAGFFTGPPDLISEITYGIFSAVLCAGLVTASQILLSRLRKGDPIILAVSIFWTALSPAAIVLAIHLIYRS